MLPSLANLRVGRTGANDTPGEGDDALDGADADTETEDVDELDDESDDDDFEDFEELLEDLLGPVYEDYKPVVEGERPLTARALAVVKAQLKEIVDDLERFNPTGDGLLDTVVNSMIQRLKGNIEILDELVTTLGASGIKFELLTRAEELGEGELVDEEGNLAAVVAREDGESSDGTPFPLVVYTPVGKNGIAAADDDAPFKLIRDERFLRMPTPAFPLVLYTRDGRKVAVSSDKGGIVVQQPKTPDEMLLLTFVNPAADLKDPGVLERTLSRLGNVVLKDPKVVSSVFFMLLATISLAVQHSNRLLSSPEAPPPGDDSWYSYFAQQLQDLADVMPPHAPQPNFSGSCRFGARADASAASPSRRRRHTANAVRRYLRDRRCVMRDALGAMSVGG